MQRQQEHIGADSQAGLCPLKAAKALKLSLFAGVETHIREKHIVSKIAFCLRAYFRRALAKKCVAAGSHTEAEDYLSIMAALELKRSCALRVDDS